LFLFDSLDGTISAWNSNGTNAVTVVDNSAAGAVYTGLAIANNGAANFILAANLASGKIDVFDSKFAPANLAGNFTDPAIPQGFAPFNVHVSNNQVYVMYAMQTPGGGPPTAGAGAGFVSLFDTNGNFIKRAISGGNLNAPWGLVLAPASFGTFGGDLLVGNFGDGTINAFDPNTFVLQGQLQDANGKPIVNDRLWEILFGQNGTGDPNTLYFSAGVNDEKGGLFGAITAAAPAPAGDFQVAASASSLTVTQGAPGTVQINITPANGFSSAVSLTASGLPTGLAFQFSPSSVTPSAGKPISSTLTISGSNSAPPPPPTNPYSATLRESPLHSRMIFAGRLFPLGLAGLFPILRRRKKTWRSIALYGSAVLTIALALGGCSGTTKSSSSTPSSTPPVTPSTSMVTVTATSGSIVHTTTIALTVQ
jgi:hypothetical protein